MIRLTDDRRHVGGVALGAIWVGDSADEAHGDLATAQIGAVLNVAQDMAPTRGWAHGYETMHVGLCDGPGNEPAAYCAAVLALHALLRRHNTLVCCHSGSRGLATAVMYLNVTATRGWHGWLEILAERGDGMLPEVNAAHKSAFARLPWDALALAMEGK